MAPVIDIKHLNTRIKGQILHKDLSLSVQKGEIFGIVGGSGCGKSVLLRMILDLMKPVSGEIRLFGLPHNAPEYANTIRSQIGVLFQSGALFSSLTVGENIQVPMREIAHIPEDLQEELTQMKLGMVGLPAEAYGKYPAELSGGMIKRAALARALAIDANLLLLDEPTAGLDPISAEAFDRLLKNLQRNLGLTVVMVTHDLDSLEALCDRVAVIVDQHAIVGTLKELKKNPHPWIQEYFKGRGHTD